MAKYKVSVKKSAIKELRKLPKSAANRIAKILKGLADDPRPHGCKKLKGFSNYWRIRSGNYRIIYSVEDLILIVEILEVIDRKDAY